ncbi:bacteriohemerythrin [Clostridium sp. ZS2-4]|uniref:bacteriohemerythrin n=1 Tax=Clostridium sp. ZS2-4 TaxID=2987703 RepID=UPI00227A9A54|nr:hemerythrin family protein [Clostridium sp. ZS2-4]MCY6356430.1 hemerythrin family protein [Clostridium sp. ZS2-4]
MIKWKEEYVIGVDNIDEQHKKLFEIASRAYALLKNEFCIDKYDKIVEILGELKEYTVYHFNSEEEYMTSIGYKKFLSHKVEHDEFIKKINNIDFKGIDEDQDKYLLQTLDFVVNWISGHILGRDKFYVNNVK